MLIAVAIFDPPNATAKYRAWRAEHNDVMKQIPPDDVRIDVGRAVGGDFVRVSVAQSYAERFFGSGS